MTYLTSSCYLGANATRQAPPIAVATTECRLLAVAGTRLFGKVPASL